MGPNLYHFYCKNILLKANWNAFLCKNSTWGNSGSHGSELHRLHAAVVAAAIRLQEISKTIFYLSSGRLLDLLWVSSYPTPAVLIERNGSRPEKRDRISYVLLLQWFSPSFLLFFPPCTFPRQLVPRFCCYFICSGLGCICQWQAHRTSLRWQFWNAQQQCPICDNITQALLL